MLVIIMAGLHWYYIQRRRRVQRLGEDHEAVQDTITQYLPHKKEENAVQEMTTNSSAIVALVRLNTILHHVTLT